MLSLGHILKQCFHVRVWTIFKQNAICTLKSRPQYSEHIILICTRKPTFFVTSFMLKFSFELWSETECALSLRYACRGDVWWNGGCCQDALHTSSLESKPPLKIHSLRLWRQMHLLPSLGSKASNLMCSCLLSALLVSCHGLIMGEWQTLHKPISISLSIYIISELQGILWPLNSAILQVSFCYFAGERRFILGVR